MILPRPRPRSLFTRFADFCTGTLLALDGLFLLLLGLFSLSDAIGPERWWLTGFLLYMPRWFWAGTAGLLLLLTLPLTRPRFARGRRLSAGRGMAFSLAFSALWALGPLMGFRIPFGLAVPVSPVSSVSSVSPAPASARLRVLTYNVKGGRRGPREIAEEIERAKPDLIQFQDAGEILLSEVGLLLSARNGWTVRRDGQYVIASREPLSELTRIELIHPDPRFFVVRATLTPTAGVSGVPRVSPITLYNVHLLSARYGLLSVRDHNITALEENLRDRLLEATLLSAAIASGPPGPILLTGDLNAPPPSMVKRRILLTGLRDTFEAAGWGYGYTYGTTTKAGHPYVRIDCILASPSIRAEAVWVGNDSGSDHRPVIADLTLPLRP